MRTHEKETQDIDMVDPHTIGGGGGKERGKTGTNPARNSKSGIPCDIPTPPEAPRTVACRSEIAGATNPQAVLDKLLSTEISVTAQEMIAASPSISKALAEMIRVRNVPSTNVVSQSHHTSGCRHRTSLLEVPITLGNTTYTAVVDSGSEVNVIRKDVWKNDVKVPMDPNASMTLRDANGGNNRLLGMIPNLEMKIGGLSTTGDFWVSSEIPPDILLGRPWQ